MNTILITGAAGFLGSHLSDAMLALNWKVVGVDNLSQGSLDNIAGALSHKKFSFTQADVRDEARMLELARGVNWIAHLAAYKIPRYGGRLATLQVNAEGTRVMLEAARANGAAFIFASTSDCYGKNPELPFHETSDLHFGASDVARWSYAVSKAYGEHLCFGFQEEYGMHTVVVRLFGSYGPRHHRSWWGGPHAVFIEAALNGQALTVHGDGQQTRSFTYVSDTVSGWTTLLTANMSDVSGKIFNVGSNREITILELAELVCRTVAPDRPPQVNLLPYDAIANRKYEDVRRRVPNAERLAALGWQPRVSVEEGTQLTVAWQRSLPRTAGK